MRQDFQDTGACANRGSEVEVPGDPPNTHKDIRSEDIQLHNVTLGWGGGVKVQSQSLPTRKGVT